MSSIDEIIQAPGEEYDLMRESIMRELHVATPGIIQSFDSENQTAVIKPVIRSRKDGKNVDMPMLTDVPVFFPGGSAGAITYPVNVGDECLVIFADGCIDGWFQNGGVANAISLRKHDYSDGFAFVGFRSKAKSIASFPSVPSMFGMDKTIFTATFDWKTGVNADTLTIPGVYGLSTDCTNVPGSWMIVYVFAPVSGDIIQFATNKTAQFYREYRNSAWSKWYTLSSSGVIGEITLRANTNGTVYEKVVAKTGDVVNFACRIADMTANNTAQGVVGTVPAAYKPEVASYFTGFIMLSNGSQFIPAIFYIDTNGQINLNYSSNATMKYFYVAGTYGLAGF